MSGAKAATLRNERTLYGRQVRDATGFRLIGYVVMPEHHLLISEPREDTPSTVLHKLKLGVAREMNPKFRDLSEDFQR